MTDAHAGIPRYKCHKEVQALKIKEVNRPASNSMVILVFEGDQSAHSVTTDWAYKSGVAVGGYFIIYEDGYTSYSPADIFEAGYTLMENQSDD